MAFQRKVEDFVCEKCGAEVQGTGYTNHCPKCLWSKHVDNDPGDRANDCGGLLEPVHLIGTTPKYRIVHKCQKCGIEKRVDVASGDDPDALVALSGKH